MSEMHLRHPGLTCGTCGPFTKKAKEYKNSKKQKMLGMFSIQYCIWRFQRFTRRTVSKYYVIRHLQMLVIQSMMDINVKWHQWSKKFLIRRLDRQEPELFLKAKN